ncbi:hypothetical protein H2198_009144 [Neophaeococcomyces mojaviensis]|uniref:Uncharacterized protein n=1 Tax=Neophaeococcomyces mojaviensis TaxID=3383035 RepID=A0ACC2ZV89_9EURO|nr:hypothetical protein H2198_009144 [Knufia sp. JES_112]
MSLTAFNQLQDVVVVGAGVIGLSAALSIQQRLPKSSIVSVVASEFPCPSPIQGHNTAETASADYASMWAGAHYRPIPYMPQSAYAEQNLSQHQQKFHDQLAQEKQLAVRTAKIMKDIAQQFPESGIQIVPAEEYLETPPQENLLLKTGDVYASGDDCFRVLDRTELTALNHKTASRHEDEIKWACSYETYVVNVHVYCGWLLHRFLSNGGKTITRNLGSLADAFTLGIAKNGSQTPLLVNCSGRNFDTDPATKIIRGQTVLVRNQYNKTITRQCADGTWSFLIPRPLNGGTIVGGTKEIGDDETHARPETRNKLLENATHYFPDFVKDMKDFDIVTDNVGRRPWREGGLRIVVEKPEDGRTVVHGYGAGGRGYELSWGAAEKICDLVLKCLQGEDEVMVKL